MYKILNRKTRKIPPPTHHSLRETSRGSFNMVFLGFILVSWEPKSKTKFLKSNSLRQTTKYIEKNTTSNESKHEPKSGK